MEGVPHLLWDRALALDTGRYVDRVGNLRGPVWRSTLARVGSHIRSFRQRARGRGVHLRGKLEERADRRNTGCPGHVPHRLPPYHVRLDTAEFAAGRWQRDQHVARWRDSFHALPVPAVDEARGRSPAGGSGHTRDERSGRRARAAPVYRTDGQWMV